MDIQFIDQVVNLLQKALELAQKLYRALQEGGPPPFSLMPEKAAIDRTTAHRKPTDLFGLWDNEAIRREYLRMQTRNRVRRWRERERRKMNAVTEGSVTSNAIVTDRNAEAATCNAAVTECNASVTPGNAAAKKEKENEKRKNQRKEIKKNKKTKDETTNSAGESDKLIPTSKLPEAYRNVVTAWNRLPLEKKLKGLYPLLIRQLGNLFKQYGEETIHKAIDRVAESPFLLGQSKNSTGWVISLGWMLESEHLEKILKGQYTDRFGGSNARLFQPGDEATPFEDGFYGTVVY